jgi:hypothetical protein
MYNIACETGNLFNGMFKFIEANSFMGPCRTYGYIVAMLFVLFLAGTRYKAVYCEVKDK